MLKTRSCQGCLSMNLLSAFRYMLAEALEIADAEQEGEIQHLRQALGRVRVLCIRSLSAQCSVWGCVGCCAQVSFKMTMLRISWLLHRSERWSTAARAHQWISHGFKTFFFVKVVVMGSCSFLSCPSSVLGAEPSLPEAINFWTGSDARTSIIFSTLRV